MTALRTTLMDACLGMVCAVDTTSGTAAPVIPHEVQAAIAAALAQDAGAWSDFDLDDDGKVSQIEVIAMLARQPGWLHRHFRELFQRIDDHDNANSYAELSSSSALADVQEFTLAQHARTLGAQMPSGAIRVPGRASP